MKNRLCSYPHHAAHLKNAVVDLKQNIQLAIDTIEKENIKFSSIAVKGVSGIMFGSILAYELDCPLAVVRSARIKTNSDYVIECIDLQCLKHYLIVDDLIDTGKTVKYIQRTIKEIFYERYNQFPMCVGIYLYDKPVFVKA